MAKHLVECVDTISTKYPRSGFVICGDFNHMKDTYFKNATTMKQIVKNATHRKSVIDLTYTNMDHLYAEPVHHPGIGRSFHQVILVNDIGHTSKPIIVYNERRKQSPKQRAQLIRCLQQIDWTPLYRLNSCEEQLKLFNTIVVGLINDFLPVTVVKTAPDEHPWISDEFKRLISIRQFHFHQGNIILYRMYRNKANRMRKGLKRKFYENKMKQLKSQNPKKWWDCVKQITGKTKSNCNLLAMANVNTNGCVQTLTENISEAFLKVTNDMVPITEGDVFVENSNEQYSMGKYVIEVDTVEAQLEKIKASKAGGPEEIPG